MRVFQKACKFRAYPTDAQERAMLSLLDTHRRLYNSALAERKAVYESEGRTVTYQEQSGHLKTARKADPSLALANFSSCQRTLKRLDRAFAAFFRRVKSGDKPGFPRFRGVGRFDSAEFTHGDGARLLAEGRGGRVYFQSVGEVKVKCHRAAEGRIKTVVFRRQAGRWFVILTCDVEQDEPEPSVDALRASDLPAVGIDLGLKSFFVTSAGESVEPPRLYRKAQAKLRRPQRSVSRKKKGGANRRKAVRALARLHQKVADARRDFHHKTALDLVRRYGRIAHEDLNIKGIARTRLAKSTHDAGWAQFLGILWHKAECARVELIAVDPRHTSQACSACGALPPVPIRLSVRTYSCVHCGFACDRDKNAARNILNRAGAPPLGANAVGYGKRCLRSPRLMNLANLIGQS